MARPQSLFWSQSRGLLVRSWHYQRRQRCSNVCNFILPPLFLVLLVRLDTVLQAPVDAPEPFEQDPRGGFAARPFEADQCTNRIRDLGDPAAVAQGCAADPFVPKVTVPFYAPSGAAANLLGGVAADSDDPAAPGQRDGVLGGYSLSPFIYPESLPDSGDPFAKSQSWYDGTFLTLYGGEERDPESPLYAAFASLESAGTGLLDAAYSLATERRESRADMLSTIFDAWFTGGAFTTYSTAYGFDRVAGDTAADFDADVTVYFNESESESVSDNCTRSCAVFSAVQRLDAAVFAAQAPGKTAAAYLRRMPNTGYEEGLNIIDLVISIILALLLHFFLPFFTGFLVYERTSRLRELMSASGCRSWTYWFTTYLALYLQYAILAVLVTIVGYGVSVPFFTLNEFLSYAILFFIWGHCLVALAIFLSPFFSSAETATVLVWLAVILVNFVGGTFIGRLSSVDTSELYWSAVMLLPSFALFRSVYYAGAFNTGGQGITVSSAPEYQGISLGMCGEGPFCRSFVFLIAEWALLMLLGLYADQVLPSGSGVRKHPLFFLGLKRGRAKGGEDLLAMEPDANELPEVAEEREFVARTVDGGPEHSEGIVLDSIHKVYGEAKPPVHAVRGMSWIARPGEITGLLGSNGSGKTTAVRALIGAHDLSAGEAYVDGKSVRTQMSEIHRSMGICLQQDIQWADLSVREHLFFFGRLRNIPKRELAGAVDRAMEAVNLTFAASRKSSECSGGMRRRLSVAMSLLGDPKTVLLDEPTSALDPATCSLVWKAIEAAKPGKSIVITTHSMEEASVLCDRLHMVTRGALRTTGIPEDLRLRLGRGYRLAAAVPESKVADFHDVMMGISEECRVETSLGGSLQYSIPKSVRLSSIFDTMAAHKERLRVRDWGVSQSSLEDVFLNIVARDEAEVGVTKLVPSAENA